MASSISASSQPGAARTGNTSFDTENARTAGQRSIPQQQASSQARSFNNASNVANSAMNSMKNSFHKAQGIVAKFFDDVNNYNIPSACDAD